MKKMIEMLEQTVDAIKKTELRKNSRASAKAVEIKRMISELKASVNTNKLKNQGVLKYINHKSLLEN